MLIKRAALGNLKASFHSTHWHRFFPLKKAFSKTYPSFLTVKEGFFLPLRLSCKERLFSKTYPSFLTLKEGSTSHLGLLSSGEKKETALLGARNRFALRLADHQRSSPCCAGWDRLKLSETIAFSNSVLNIVISSKTFLEISIASFIFISPS